MRPIQQKLKLLSQSFLRGSMTTAALLLSMSTFSPLVIAQDKQPTPERVDETQVIATDLEASETPDKVESIKNEVSPSAPVTERLAKQQQAWLEETQFAAMAVHFEDENGTLAYWRDDISGAPKGAVVLLHDDGRNPIWPETLANFHEYLPRHGWATLSVEIASLPSTSPPPRKVEEPIKTATENTPKSEEDSPSQTEAAPPADSKIDETQVVYDDSEEASDTKEDMSKKAVNPNPVELKEPKLSLKETINLNQTRIAAAMDFLRSKSHFNIAIIGMGVGGIQASIYTNQATAAPTTKQRLQKIGQGTRKEAVIDGAVRALIRVDMNTDYAEFQPDSYALQTPGVATLDISSAVSLKDRKQMEARKYQSQKAGYQVYRQRFITPANGTLYQSQETELSRAVRGFLQRYVAGEAL